MFDEDNTLEADLDYSEPKRTFDVDPIAIAWNSYQKYLAKETPADSVDYLVGCGISGDYRLKDITDEDIAKAKKIRRYYKKKFLTLALSNKIHSKFRQDFYEFLCNDDVYRVRQSFIPIIVKAPSFYTEDVTLDKIEDMLAKKELHNTMDDFVRETTWNFKLLYTTDRITKKVKERNYWFKYTQDSGKDYLARLSLDLKNPLLHLFEREIESGSVDIQGAMSTHTIRGRNIQFSNIQDWKIIHGNK